MSPFDVGSAIENVLRRTAEKDRYIEQLELRNAALESQLAAQASAVDNLIQAGQLLYVSLSYFHDMPSVLPSAHQGNSIAERKWREALAALVNGQEGKEER